MAETDHNLSTHESIALNTTLEPTVPEATADMIGSQDLSSNPTGTSQAAEPVAEAHELQAAANPAAPPAAQVLEPEYDDQDFARALASFDKEQAAEKDVAQSLTTEEAVI